MLFRSDRKSTRLNSSHLVISYAVFCLKKKKKQRRTPNADGRTVPHGPGAAGAPPAAPGEARRQRSTAQCSHRARSMSSFFFFLMIGGPPRSTLFPYTTLFR